MAYAFIHGEVKGSGASVEFKGNGLDLLDLTIQIVGSVVAEVPEPLRPYVIKKIQDKIPDAVQNDLEAQGKAAPAEKKEKPPVGETVGFRMCLCVDQEEPEEQHKLLGHGSVYTSERRDLSAGSNARIQTSGADQEPCSTSSYRVPGRGT